MRLTEQQRAELERRRFRPVPISDDGVVIVDYVGQRQWYIGSGDGELTYRRAVELAAVLGITPPGYRLVPERLADRAAREIMALARAHSTSGFKRDAEELQALASALQGEVEKRG